MADRPGRRSLLFGAAAASAGIALAACARMSGTGESGEGVGAVEDLMREHGVIRRAILVYRETAARLRTGAEVDAKALLQTATLLRKFGEDYHERALEETHIFPAVKKAGGPAAPYVDVLLAQHARGREITDYVLGALAGGAIAAGDRERLASAFQAFELMYANHAGREDTIVFPAWKETMSASALHEAGEEFEEIEHRTFGEGGFGDAVKQIGEIEAALGLADLSQFTAPSP